MPEDHAAAHEAPAADSLERIAADAQACQRCPLGRIGPHGVPGSGDARAEVLLVGEAPSYYDAQRGYPFSGPSGVLLDELLTVAGLDRERVYLTNVVKHRTPEGRSPLPDEIAACATYLTRQIAVINPRVIVALGRFAAARFFPRARITQIHGRARALGGRIVVAMYNPAAAIHREELRAAITQDFRHALPEALIAARRQASGDRRSGPALPPDEQSPQQMPLF